MKLGLEELLNQRMEKLVEQQNEATRATADVAKQLYKIYRAKRSSVQSKRTPMSAKSSATDFSEEIR
jgi:hypothetical protein